MSGPLFVVFKLRRLNRHQINPECGIDGLYQIHICDFSWLKDLIYVGICLEMYMYKERKINITIINIILRRSS